MIGLTEESHSPDEKKRLSMRIEGMHCASCVASIEKALAASEGVLSASVSLLDEKAVVEYDPSSISRVHLEYAVKTTGYRIKRAAMSLTITPSPAKEQWDKIQTDLIRTEGIITTDAYLNSSRIVIEYDDDLVTLKIVKRVFKANGFEVEESQVSGLDRET